MLISARKEPKLLLSLTLEKIIEKEAFHELLYLLLFNLTFLLYYY